MLTIPTETLTRFVALMEKRTVLSIQRNFYNKENGLMTIRGLDETMTKTLKEKAIKEGTSVNAILLKTLRESLGLKKKQRIVTYDDLDYLYITSNIFAHLSGALQTPSCRLVRHPSLKKDSRQAGMTANAQ